MASLEGLGWRWRDADEVWVVSDRDWDGLIVGPTRIEPDDVPSEALELEPLIAWHVELSCDAGDAGERRAARRVLAAARLLAGDGGGSIGDDSSLLFDPQTQTHVVHAKFASHLGDRLARATPQRHRVPPELIRITTLPRTTRSHPNILLHLQLGGVRPSGEVQPIASGVVMYPMNRRKGSSGYRRDQSVLSGYGRPVSGAETRTVSNPRRPTELDRKTRRSKPHRPIGRHGWVISQGVEDARPNPRPRGHNFLL